MSAPLRFGFGFDLRNPEAWFRPWAAMYAEHLDFIAWTERLGFGGVWFAEHHGIDDGYLPSPLVIGAAVAARTSTLRISQGVALAPHYHPVRLAEDVAVLDIISNGRVELALGLGYKREEAAAYGFDRRDRGPIADEVLQIVRRLWAGETVTFDGGHWSITDARVTPLPVQEGGVPLFVGAAGPAGLRRAARLGDGYIGGVDAWPRYVDEVRACGKDPATARIVSLDHFLVSEDPERTFQEAAPHAYYRVRTYAEWMAHTEWGFQPMDFETFQRSGMLKVLTPEDAIAAIRAKLAAAPIEALCLQAPTGYPLPKLAEHAELFATKVLPAFC